MKRHRLTPGVALALALALPAACSAPAAPAPEPPTFKVTVTAVNGSATLPTASAPLPANTGNKFETWAFTVEARSPAGDLEPFDGVVRLSTRPGAVVKVEGSGAVGRNLRLRGGKAEGVVTVTAVYGPARLWVEDLGYVPAPAGKKPACANGVNDDPEEDTLIDFPADPGCAFADDDTEQGGTFAAGVSAPLAYALPTISDIQGRGSTSPYPYESIEINASLPERLVVTRVASDGFYVTDVSSGEVSKGYNGIFAFNFSTPSGMRVCDEVTYLSGTINEFFGFTELSFPSYRLRYPDLSKEPCLVPEPAKVEAATLADAAAMEKLESSLARIEGFHVAKNFGPRVAKNNVFGPDQSNCDVNGDGQLDFTSFEEGSCANACSADPECSEWTGYSARGNYKASKGGSMIQIQTGAAPGFDPIANRGVTLPSFTGTLRNFSGGTLNWTLEARCSDDVVCAPPGCVCEGCAAAALSSQKACVRLRSEDDNDQGTN